MDIPKIKMPEIGALNSLKDRLGFSSEGTANDEEYDYQQDGYDGGYDDGYGTEPSGYDGYDGYDSYDGGYDDGFGSASDAYRSNGYGDYGYASDYAAPEPISGASPRVNPASRSYGADGSRVSSYGSSPKLVTLDDVRAHTAAPSGYQRDPLERIRENTETGEYRARSVSAVANRSAADSFDAHGMDTMGESGTAGAASAAAPGAADAGIDVAAERSKGLNALFGGAAPASVSGRALNVVRPSTYEDAEEIAHTLRRGDVVVLDLAVTDPALSKRILDFSFGAASMVNARVDCLARSVFSLQTGDKLNEQELGELRAKGVF